ncbi:lysosomal proton-coupled steroid conjugate and bile acid symporter SLC46A3-like isoform X2 [Styela clava]
MVCKFPYPVEAIVFLTCACCYSFQVIQNQYIYMIVAKLHNYTENNSVDYCSNNKTATIDGKIVVDDASRWTMYSCLAFFLPCAVFSLIVTAWSDKIGRKWAIAIPTFGTAIGSAVQVIAILYRLPLYWTIIVSFIYGASGSYVAILNIGTAYLSDITYEEDRDRRFTILQACASFGGGVVLVASGYWIDSQGFIPSSIFITGCAIAAILFIPMMTSAEHDKYSVLPYIDDSVNANQDSLQGDKCYRSNVDRKCPMVEDECDESTALLHNKEITIKTSKSTFCSQIKVIWRIYTTEKNICYHVEDSVSDECFYTRRLWRLWFFVISYAWYTFVINGSAAFQTLFFISYPICFTPGMIGLQNGIASGLVILSPLIIKFYESVLRLRTQSILLLTICTRLSSTLMMGFAKSPILVFSATSIGVLSTFPNSIIRSQISKLVSSSEQGSALALLSGIEAFFGL